MELEWIVDKNIKIQWTLIGLIVINLNNLSFFGSLI